MKPEAKRSFVVPMGGYTVFNRSRKGFTELQSVGAETCVIVVLQSPKGIALAHVDTPNAAEAMRTIIKELGNKNISATLVGGDVGYVFGSASIYNSIYLVLRENNIKFTHNNYSYWVPSLTLPLIYSLLRITNFIGPESIMYSTLTLAACLGIGRLIANNTAKSFDVKVNLENGEILIVPTSTANLEEAKELMLPNNWDFFRKRNLEDPRTIKDLKECPLPPTPHGTPKN